jgi:SAM-dependent methyltransferase
MVAKKRREKPPWSEYYEATANGLPWGTLKKALALSESEKSEKRGGRLAIDLGCGAGRDTLELLHRGWRVLAIDNQPEAMMFLRSAVPPSQRRRLRTRLASFETVRLPKSDLINASYSIPFCRPERFDAFWRKIVASLRSGGWFSAHFFGVRDEWVGSEDLTFQTSAQVKALLNEFEKKYFRDREWDGRTASGKRKHWHVISVVARKL